MCVTTITGMCVTLSLHYSQDITRNGGGTIVNGVCVILLPRAIVEHRSAMPE